MNVLFEQYLALKKGKVAEAPTPNQATQGIPFETLEALHKEVLDRLDARGVADPAGLDSIDFGGPRYNEARGKLNETWLACLENRASVEDFKKALGDYEEAVPSDIQRPKTLEAGRLF